MKFTCVYSFVNLWLKGAANIKVYIIIIQRSVHRLFIYFSELYTIRLNDVAVFEWDNYNIEWFLVRENDFFQIKHFSFRINFDLQFLFERSGKNELEEEPGED